MKKLNLFELAEKNDELMRQLPDFFEDWEKEIESAAPLFELEGMKLEVIARNVPQHQAKYAHLGLQARGVTKWLENQKARAESRYVKNYNNSPRALGVKEQGQYLQGEKDIVELNQLIIQASTYQLSFDEIVEAIRQMGWMVGHITKLRVAELQDAIL
jgi:hypothetical protein